MAAAPSPEPRWRRRTGLALSIRGITVVVPLGLSVTALVVCGRLLHRPSGSALLGWYAALFAGSWAVLWLTRRALHRLLPLAALLELTLSFPESAPSRLLIAKKSVSTRDLAALLVAPAEVRENETTQQAAERILTLMAALARHDRHTRGHAERVRAYTDLIARRVGLSRRDRDKLQWAALLHDIGKLHVPAALLNKPAKPTAREWEVLKSHPEAGSRIVAPLLEWLGEWGDVIVQHHEHFNGGGYPRGLVGHQICRGARIVSVADSLEVMTAPRPYRRPVRKEAALREVVRCSGTQFDPDIVRALLDVPDRKLMLAMGPTAWLAGLPFLGQGPVQVIANLASQTAASAGAVAVVATSVHPASFATDRTAIPATTAKPMATLSAPPAAARAGSPRSQGTSHDLGAGRSSQPSSTPVATAFGAATPSDVPDPQPTAAGPKTAHPEPPTKSAKPPRLSVKTPPGATKTTSGPTKTPPPGATKTPPQGATEKASAAKNPGGPGQKSHG